MSLDADSSEDEVSRISSPVDVGDEHRDKTKNVGGASRFLDSSDEEEERKGQVIKSENNHSRTGVGLDSSDDEDTTKDAANTKNILNADSSDDSGPDDMPSTKEAEEKGSQTSKKKTILEKPQDSDSETENRHRSLFNNKDLYDAESSDEEAGQRAKNNSDDSSSNDDPASSPQPADQSDDGDNSTGLETSKDKKGGHERKSKSSAMSEIRSESQRMVRETKVSLPYHKARQTSLAAFLNRKKGMPEIVKSMKLSKLTLEADVLLKEREKKMAEFYKSEDEEASNDEDQEYQPGVAVVEGDQHADDQKLVIGDASIQETMNDNTKEPDEKDQVNICQDDINGSNSQSKALESAGVEIEVPSSGMPNGNECGNDLSSNNKDSESPVTESVSAMQSESLNLILEETPDVSDASEVLSSSADKKQIKLDMLKKQIDCSILEKTLQVTPRLYSGDIDNDELFSPKGEISHGAQKLLNRYVNHAKFKGSPSINSQSENKDINVIVKKTTADGTEVLEKEVVKYNPQKSKKSEDNNLGYLSMKDKLKKKMFVKKKENIKMREELMKINNEEYDDLPEDQLIDEKEEEIEDEEYEGDDDSDLEENDVDLTEKKGRRRGLFLDDEADESGEEGGDEEESDAESLNLVQADDDEDADEVLQSGRKIGYRKIKSSHLLSDDDEVEDTNTKQQDVLLSDLETPNVDTCSVRSFAGSTHSSASSAIFNTVPRWTPFKDRIDANGVEYPSASLCDPADSPTASQMARKKLGFEELCDPNNLEAEDVDDVIGLCSGKFATQPDRPLQQNLTTQQEPDEFSFPTNALTSIESQDTVILTGSCPVLSGRPEAGCLDDLLGLDGGNVDEEADDGTAICPSDEEAPGFLQEDIGADRVLHSDDDDMIFIKKRKRVISDDEESDRLSDVGQLEDVDDGGPPEKDAVDTRTTLFDKKGKLRKDFFDNEAELSGSEEELSDDEDERGLDRLEMEEGDLEDIDEAEEMDKVGRIHQKALLDEDQADIRLFQERFLEDGDLHTDNKRTRQFKWKGLDDMVEFNKQDSDSEEEGDAGDVDENWRLQRLEREKWVKENKEKGVEGEENHMFRLQSNISVKATSIETKSKRVEEEEVTNSISVETRAGPLLPIATNRFQRSSFLARGESTLEKMASLTKKADDRTGTGAKKGRNFVFAALSPKKTVEQDPVDAANPPPPQPAAAKRKKVVPVAKKLKVDRTLQSNNKTSIFNLM